jgi:TRAP-type C4-dicarboxylate transport system substrate-binding protein
MDFLRTAVIVGASLWAGTGVHADVVLKASHQWPGGTGDMRDEAVQMIAREMASADVGVTVRVYPGESLFKARDQWPAMLRGQLDITALPLDYVSGRHPEFNATLMPGLVKNHAHAERLDASPFMTRIRKVINDAGVIVLADAWLAGGFVSSKNCILDPGDIAGQVTRAAGPAFERMLVGAGASISSMPSSEIYTAMQTGVLDAANTSSGSLVSYRIYEQSKCFTAPGEHALWFMYEPILMAKRSWDRLSGPQQQALTEAADHAEAYLAREARKQDETAEDVFRSAGVQVVHMSAAQVAAWRAIAERTSYKYFAEHVSGGQALLDAAMKVE